MIDAQNELKTTWEGPEGPLKFAQECLRALEEEDTRSISSRITQKSICSRGSSRNSSTNTKDTLTSIKAKRAVLQERLKFTDVIKEQEKTLTKLKLEQELSETLAEEAIYEAEVIEESAISPMPYLPTEPSTILHRFLNSEPSPSMLVHRTTPPYPTTPTQPAQPEIPTTPPHPTTPSQPAHPTTPTQPAIPTIPPYPTTPSQPAHPTTTTQPEIPTTPPHPTTPSQPAHPTTPTQPAIPTIPPYPTTPSQPAHPTTTTQPEIPTTPPYPTTPSQPAHPTTPTQPANPTAPLHPTQPTFETFHPSLATTTLFSPHVSSPISSMNTWTTFTPFTPRLATSTSVLPRTAPCARTRHVFQDNHDQNPASLHRHSSEPLIISDLHSRQDETAQHSQQLIEALAKVTQIQRLPQAKTDVYGGDEKDKIKYFLWEKSFDALVQM